MKSPWTNPNKKKMKSTTSMGIKPADVNTLREVDVDVVAAFDKWLTIGTPPVDLLHVGKVGQFPLFVRFPFLLFFFPDFLFAIVVHHLPSRVEEHSTRKV